MSATHDHDHDHGSGHSHAPDVTSQNERVVLIGFLLTFGFMFAEIIGGILSGSLALIADAGHMLTDAAALALAWAGFRFGRRAADSKRTFGYMRFEVLAGFVNAVALMLLVAWIDRGRDEGAVLEIIDDIDQRAGLAADLRGARILCRVAVRAVKENGARRVTRADRPLLQRDEAPGGPAAHQRVRRGAEDGDLRFGPQQQAQFCDRDFTRARNHHAPTTKVDEDRKMPHNSLVPAFWVPYRTFSLFSSMRGQK